MSRVGKHSIAIPSGVQASLDAGRFVAKSSNGGFDFLIPDGVQVVIDGNSVVVSMSQGTKKSDCWGTTRAIINNGITGLVTPFKRRIELVGVGYRASVQGKDLVLQLGYSHDITFPIPDGVSVVCEKPTTIVISSSDKAMVGQVVRKIQSFRKPEPYKGKGVIMEGQYVLRKEGKKK